MSQHKPWYRKSWGIIIVIFILPYFLLWYLWAKTSWRKGLKVLITAPLAIAVLISLGITVAIFNSGGSDNSSTSDTSSSQADSSSQTNTPEPAAKSATTTTKPASQTAATAAPASTPQPTPQHTVVYQFSLMSGSMNATDQQNVGISWKDPTTGKNQIPTDIAGAIQQINAGSYSVTYHVSSINKDNLNDGVNNYSDPDATIACTILVDGSPVSNEIAPESGYADCSGNGLDSQSGN